MPTYCTESEVKVSEYCKENEIAATRAKAALLTAIGQPGNMRDGEVFTPDVAHHTYQFSIGGTVNNTGKLIELGEFTEETKRWAWSKDAQVQALVQNEPRLSQTLTESIHFPILTSTQFIDSVDQYDLSNTVAIKLGYFGSYFEVSETGDQKFYAITLLDADGDPLTRKWCSICGAFESADNAVISAPGDHLGLCMDSARELVDIVSEIRKERIENPPSTPRVYGEQVCAWCTEKKAVDFLATPFFNICFPCEETIAKRISN